MGDLRQEPSHAKSVVAYFPVCPAVGANPTSGHPLTVAGAAQESHLLPVSPRAHQAMGRDTGKAMMSAIADALIAL